MRDFISREELRFHFRIGRLLASSLSGFIAGVVAVGVFWALNTFISSAAF